MGAIGQESFKDKFEETKAGSLLKFKASFNDSLSNSAELPVVIIKGKEKGKVLTILAGVHGYEYPPIMAVQEFLGEIRPMDLKGSLIVIPISSTAAFYGRSVFINPNDGVNLNNAFPGKEKGTVTQQVAHYITKNIIPLTDVFLDIHGGDASEDLIPFVCYYNHQGQPKATAMAKKLSETSGFSNIVSYDYTLKDTEPAKYAFKQAVQDGKVGLSFEAGKLGNVQADAVALNKNGIYNVMNGLQMYRTKLDLPSELKKYNDQGYIKASTKGIFYSDIKAGDFVQEGQDIGYITDEFGAIIKTIKASGTGVVLYMVGTPPVNKDDTLFCIGAPE
ncbi:M14 family metallopeptidase [Cytophaga sp. FL35]|uniref:M14 family metallopeptidase n=1 Tax=Cytophaga sp. FL35 TaxID=1904456 RepID=UPI001CA41718|nr:M14 family metallopeptidase [Cytophaga sp. FL35]